MKAQFDLWYSLSTLYNQNWKFGKIITTLIIWPNSQNSNKILILTSKEDKGIGDLFGRGKVYQGIICRGGVGEGPSYRGV